jgi:hypothetical protein
LIPTFTLDVEPKISFGEKEKEETEDKVSLQIGIFNSTIFNQTAQISPSLIKLFCYRKNITIKIIKESNLEN